MTFLVLIFITLSIEKNCFFINFTGVECILLHKFNLSLGKELTQKINFTCLKIVFDKLLIILF